MVVVVGAVEVEVVVVEVVLRLFLELLFSVLISALGMKLKMALVLIVHVSDFGAAFGGHFHLLFASISVSFVFTGTENNSEKRQFTSGLQTLPLQLPISLSSAPLS